MASSRSSRAPRGWSSRSRGASTRARTRGVTGCGTRGRTRRRHDAEARRRARPARGARPAGGGARGPRPAPRAAAVARALADLAGEDAARREAAVALLGETRDPKWLAFLAALREGSVYARTRGGTLELVVGGAKAARGDQEGIEIQSAYDRAPLGTGP